MPVLEIKNTKQKKAKKRNALIDQLTKAVARIKALGITKEQVTVIFPVAMKAKHLGKDIVVSIDLFKDEENRTPKVMDKLAEVVGIIVFEAYKKAKFVEVIPKGHDPKTEGYWSKRRD